LAKADAEVAPDAVYPLTGERIADIAARLGREGFSLRPDVVVR
jgi:hypothetical protein